MYRPIEKLNLNWHSFLFQLPELKGDIKRRLLQRNHVFQTSRASKFGHSRRSVKEEVLRTPITMGWLLRLTVADQAEKLAKPVGPLSVVRFNSKLDNFLEGYSAQMRVVFAPIPFPLLQLSRTWVFLWVFTLPLSLETDGAGIFARCFIVFFLTFAYLGLELMSIQLEDPFGSDDNDVSSLSANSVLCVCVCCCGFDPPLTR